ncbi:MAG TPA: diaminopimelate epimerase [Bacillota bacterium]|nr:diaminopimelate epimerase [Bacillota bacterium]
MRFTKMHGLGNDFIITEEPLADSRITSSEFVRRICDRHEGIGADGLVILSSSDEADCRMTIINSDGREAESCGNALRCVAHFAHKRSYGRGTHLSVETLAGVQRAQVTNTDEHTSTVEVDMGYPLLEPGDFPATLPGPGPVLAESVTTAYGIYKVALVRVGVPHVVIFMDDVSAVDLAKEGKALEQHPLFPAGANVNFVQQVGERRFVVRVWERGAGETMACGTGACSVAVAAILLGRATKQVLVSLPGGELDISWTPGSSVIMRGPAVEVFTGQYHWQE